MARKIPIQEQVQKLREVDVLNKKIAQASEGLYEKAARNLAMMVPLTEKVAIAQKEAKDHAEEYEALLKRQGELSQKIADQSQKRVDSEASMEEYANKILEIRKQIKDATEEEADVLRGQLGAYRRDVNAMQRSINATERHLTGANRELKDLNKREDKYHKQVEKSITKLKTVKKHQNGMKALYGATATVASAMFKVFKVGYDAILETTKKAIERQQSLRDNARDYALQVGVGYKAALRLSYESREAHLRNQKLYKNEAEYINDIASAIQNRGDVDLVTSRRFKDANFVLRGAMGATAAESEKLIYYFDKVSKEGVINVTEGLYQMGKQAGIAGGFIKNQLVGGLELFAKHGAQRGLRAFKKLLVASKNTGIEVSSLGEAFAQFDNFEGGLETANKLNQMFGTNISSLRMMAMDEAERMDHVMKQVKATSGGFENMDRWQKSFLAKTFNMNVDQLEAMMKGEKYVDPQIQSAQTMRDAAKAIAKDSKDIAHNMKVFGEKLLKNNTIQELVKKIESFTKTILGDKSSVLNKLLKWLNDPEGANVVDKMMKMFIKGIDAFIRALGGVVDLLIPGSDKLAQVLKGGIGSGVMQDPNIWTPEEIRKNQITDAAQSGSTMLYKDWSKSELYDKALQSIKKHEWKEAAGLVAAIPASGKENKMLSSLADTLNLAVHNDQAAQVAGLSANRRILGARKLSGLAPTAGERHETMRIKEGQNEAFNKKLAQITMGAMGHSRGNQNQSFYLKEVMERIAKLLTKGDQRQQDLARESKRTFNLMYASMMKDKKTPGKIDSDETKKLKAYVLDIARKGSH